MTVSKSAQKKPATPKITVAMTNEMVEALEEERKIRKIATIPEVVRIIVSEYFKVKESGK
jgi:hypothetical protein